MYLIVCNLLLQQQQKELHNIAKFIHHILTIIPTRSKHNHYLQYLHPKLINDFQHLRHGLSRERITDCKSHQNDRNTDNAMYQNGNGWGESGWCVVQE